MSNEQSDFFEKIKCLFGKHITYPKETEEEYGKCLASHLGNNA
jgi:hypothetical protein